MKAERQTIKRRSRLVPGSVTTAAALLLIVLCFVLTTITFCVYATEDSTCNDPNDGTCSDQEGKTNECEDLHESCGLWAAKGECVNNDRYMTKHCRLSCDLCDLDSGDSEYDDDTEGIYDSSDDDEDEYDDDDDDGDDPSCEDKHRKCSMWSKLGECTTNSRYMLSNCPRACGSCTQGDDVSDCKDRAEDEECTLAVARGDCLAEKGHTMKYCRKSCYHCISDDEADEGGEEFLRKKRYAGMDLGPPQNIAGTKQEREEAIRNLRRVDQYLRETMIMSDVSDEQRKKCRNLSAHCSFWAGRGRCEDKKDFMLRQCRLACLSCT